MKSLLIAVMMLATAMFVMISIDNVSASVDIGIYRPKAFHVTYISFDGKTYAAQHGLQVYGQVNISWNASWCHKSLPVGYNFTVGNANNNGGSFGAEKWKASANGGNSTYYLWDTTMWADGDYYINVTATNSNDGIAGRWWTNASHSWKVTVRNTMRRIPGVTQFQGGNFEIAGRRSTPILTTATSVIHYNEDADNAVDITVNSGLNWTSTYSLYYPVYNGSEAYTGAYGLTWKRYSPTNTISGTDYTIDDVILDRAGLWVIDVADGSGYTDADFRNISQYNSTVAGWFWVNTSTNFTVDVGTANSFFYNASGTVPFVLKEGASIVTDAYAIGDIRYKNNRTSIRDANVPLTSGTPENSRPYYKNNSYDIGDTYENYEGFWSVGNYTTHGYLDMDYWTGNQANGRTQYQKGTSTNGVYTMASGTHGWVHYNETWGSNIYKNGSATWISAATYYNWSLCGPWDPPEKNATIGSIRVKTGTPSTSLINDSVYFDFPGGIQINITENPSGTSLRNVNVYVYNELGINVSNQFISTKHRGDNWVESGDVGKGVIDIGNITKGRIKINHSSWGKATDGHAGEIVTPFGRNGSWTVQIYADYNGDRGLKPATTRKPYTEEWNTSVSFTVKSSINRIIFTMIDDDGAVTGGTNTDGVIRRVPQGDTPTDRSLTQPVNITFKVENSNHKFLGQGSKAAGMKNITLSGDALFLEDGPVRLDKFPNNMVTYTAATHQWKVALTPKMALNGGTINIAVDWGTSGTHTETITIGGTGLNGSVVDISPATFSYGVNTTISVTVTSPTDASYGYSNAAVALYWLRDDGDLGDRINATDNPDTTNGNVYSFHFNKTQQSNWQVNATSNNGWGTTIKAPRNITAYVNVPSVGYGYAKSKMEAVKDLKITTYPTMVMAGKGLNTYGESNSFWVNVTKIDSSGNSTGYPSASGLTIRIYNDTGHDITADIGSLSAAELDGSYKNYNFSGEYFREPGTYILHVYNNTHKSEGIYNQTLIVEAVDVTSSMGDFIWGFDKNISTTFTATWNGQPINNSGATDYFRIDNISKQNSGSSTQYNKTWANTSFRWGKQAAGSDQNSGNSSLEVSRYSGGFINGVVTINDITANELDENLVGKPWNRPSQRKIHFMYKPTTSGSVYANCSGEVLVKIPDVSASPASLPYNKPAELTLTVTGRTEPLNNVRVNITVPGLTAIPGSDTITDGTVTFAFTPPATGNVRIDIENRTSSVRVPVTSWACYIEADAQVNEGNTFKVTVKNGTAGGAVIVGATVTIRGIGTETTNANGEATFIAPSVTSDRDYTITATFEGHAEDTETITVINVPVLTIVYPDEVEGCSTFEVIIADDAGNSIIGATITASDGETYTSGVNGIAKIAALDKKGSMTLTASKTGFADSETVTITVKACPGIPGFELLTLIAALGVAFILFRRRRRR